MDHRFPAWLRTVVNKLDFLALPNLGMLVCALGVVAYIAQMTGYSAIDNFVFDPTAIREGGQWWRLFAFPMSDPGSTPTNPFFFFFFVLFTYFVFQSIEEHWGDGPLTVFVLLSYICAVAGALVLEIPTNIWYYVLLNVNLVFGTLFPDFEILFFFILPIKAKWLLWLSGALLLFKFVMGGWYTKAFLGFALFPYFLFFGPYFFKEIRTRAKISKNRQRFDKDMWR